MSFVHKELASGRWQTFSFLQQMGNIGSEIDRAIRWKQNNEPILSQGAFERALELLALTIQDPKNRSRLKELCRVRETLIDYFMYDNVYGSSDELWHRYFYFFAVRAQIERNLRATNPAIHPSSL